MTRYLKIIVTLLVFLLVFGGMTYTSLVGGTQYFEHVDDVMNHESQWEGRSFLMHGFVVPGSILRRPNTLDYRFQIEYPAGLQASGGQSMDVWYTGIVPDTFQDGAEVVLRGQLTTDGFYTAKNGITAKCPSKYVEKK